MKQLCTLLLCALFVFVSCAPETRSPLSPGPLTSRTIIAGAPTQLRLGIVVFLSGGAAKPFGLPARNGAEALIADLNLGNAPAPYNTPGIGGVPLSAVYVDENGGSDQQVSEIRRLFLEEKVDVVIGYSSSGDCLAVAPISEELQRLTVIFDCGTSRLFEERDYRYVFRTNAHQAIDSLGGARYMLEVSPQASRLAGINQNYSWGQDSWAHFRDTILQLEPGGVVVSEQFPKLNAGDYSAEILALADAQADVIHTSFWGEDLNEFIRQARGRGLLRKSKLLLSVGEYALPSLGDQIVEGTIVGAHGPHGVMAPPGSLNDWLIKLYQSRYRSRPTYPVYHMAQAILGLKMAYEKALASSVAWPSTEDVVEAFEYSEFLTPSGLIKMSIGKGHQAVEPAVYGTAGSYNAKTGEVDILNVRIYPAGCVNPPEGVTTEQWIKNGFPGNDCP